MHVLCTDWRFHRHWRVQAFKGVVALGLAVLISLTITGCPSTAPPPAAVVKPFPGATVELLVPAGLQLPARWEVSLNEWMDGTGASTRWVEYDPSDPAALDQALQAPVPTGGRIVLFSLRRLPQVESQLHSLDAAVEHGLDLKDLFRGLRERVLTRQRETIAFPIATPVFVCYYRADLLRKAGLQPPQTWDDYQALLESLEQWAPGMTAVEPLAPDDRAALLFARSLSFAKHPENYTVWFDLESGQPLLKTDGFRHAITVAAAAWRLMPPQIAQMTPADCRQAIVSGKAALGIGIEPTLSLEQRPGRSEGSVIGISRLPGSRRVFNPNANRWEAQPDVHAPGLCGFSGQVLGLQRPDPKAPAAAAHLLAMLASESFDSNWSSVARTPCRESQLASAATWHETGLTLEESSRAVDALAQSLRDLQLVSDLPLTSGDEFRAATRDVVGKLLAGEIPAEDCADQLQAEFARIVERLGAGTVKADYRRGLGLPPAFGE